MDDLIAFLGYCAAAFAVAAASRVWIKTLWLFLFVAPTVSAMLFQFFAFIYYGAIDYWVVFAFLPTWFIGFGCTLAYFLIWKVVNERKPPDLAMKDD